MAKIKLQGNPIDTIGDLPKIGSKLKDFKLVQKDLSIASLENFEGVNLVLNIFPSLDTGTCAASVRNFNKEAAALNDTKVLCISRDLPFAQGRFCGAEGIENVVTLSDFNTGAFGKDNGLEIENGPLAGLHSRVVIVLNKAGEIIYTEQVSDIVDEPNYKAAIEALG